MILNKQQKHPIFHRHKEQKWCRELPSLTVPAQSMRSKDKPGYGIPEAQVTDFTFLIPAQSTWPLGPPIFSATLCRLHIHFFGYDYFPCSTVCFPPSGFRSVPPVRCFHAVVHVICLSSHLLSSICLLSSRLVSSALSPEFPLGVSHASSCFPNSCFPSVSCLSTRYLPSCLLLSHLALSICVSPYHTRCPACPLRVFSPSPALTLSVFTLFSVAPPPPPLPPPRAIHLSVNFSPDASHLSLVFPPRPSTCLLPTHLVPPTRLLL